MHVEEKMNYELQGKVIILTGANSGIGKAASIQLATLGATVIMACRSRERGMQALEEVRCAAASPAVELIQVDIASQRSIRQFVADFKRRHEHLHVLIHNAANFDQTQKEPVLTDDALETIFATNHLGPFLMTSLLLDMLKASAPSRVITVACKGLISYPFLDIDFTNLHGERYFSGQHAYYHSKQAQLMFTFFLANRLRWTGVTVHCVRVGDVAIPDERLAHLPRWMLKIHELRRKFSITPEQMAETYVWLAADPVGEQQTGKYWKAPGIRVKANRKAYNEQTQKRLWAVSDLFTSSIEHDLD
jgi:NAD(P)-dependent dehydrogenase (short-subunit alcohol dehydrogenase family)